MSTYQPNIEKEREDFKAKPDTMCVSGYTGSLRYSENNNFHYKYAFFGDKIEPHPISKAENISKSTKIRRTRWILQRVAKSDIFWDETRARTARTTASSHFKSREHQQTDQKSEEQGEYFNALRRTKSEEQGEYFNAPESCIASPLVFGISFIHAIVVAEIDETPGEALTKDGRHAPVIACVGTAPEQMRRSMQHQ